MKAVIPARAMRIPYQRMYSKPCAKERGSRRADRDKRRVAVRTKSVSGVTVEEEPMGALDPYSSSKDRGTRDGRASQIVPEAGDIASHGTSGASARAGNINGGGDWVRDRLTQDVVRALMEGRAAHIWNPLSIRPQATSTGIALGVSHAGATNEAKWCCVRHAMGFGADKEGCRPGAWIADRLVELRASRSVGSRGH